jgi:hypothetical protein
MERAFETEDAGLADPAQHVRPVGFRHMKGQFSHFHPTRSSLGRDWWIAFGTRISWGGRLPSRESRIPQV